MSENVEAIESTNYVHKFYRDGCGEKIMESIDLDKVSIRVHKEVDALNRVVDEAISHGGDSGGAYFTNKDGLESAVKDYLDVTGLDYVAGLYWKDDDDPLVVANEKELRCIGCVRNYLEARGIE